MKDFDKKLKNITHLAKMLVLMLILSIFAYSIAKYVTFDAKALTFETTSSKIYDKDMALLWEISKGNAVRNKPISINDVPRECKNAIVSIEDRTFWSNIGVDLKGLARLGISLFSKGSLGGGSTISQQVIKNSFQNIYNRDPLDKLNESIYSIKMNSVISKETILEMYLNNIYFGNLNYGIESASLDYFNKTSSELNLAECSYLLGIPQWPGVYNPFGNQERGKVRQKRISDTYLMRLDNPESVLAWIEDQEEEIEYQGKFLSIEEYIDVINNYKFDEIIDIANEILDWKHVNIGIVSKEDPNEVNKKVKDIWNKITSK